MRSICPLTTCYLPLATDCYLLAHYLLLVSIHLVRFSAVTVCGRGCKPYIHTWSATLPYIVEVTIYAYLVGDVDQPRQVQRRVVAGLGEVRGAQQWVDAGARHPR